MWPQKCNSESVFAAISQWLASSSGKKKPPRISFILKSIYSTFPYIHIPISLLPTIAIILGQAPSFHTWVIGKHAIAAIPCCIVASPENTLHTAAWLSQWPRTHILFSSPIVPPSELVYRSCPVYPSCFWKSLFPAWALLNPTQWQRQVTMVWTQFQVISL